jgi:hypothetical protein
VFKGPASTLEVGARATVCGEVDLIAQYEWDAFDLAETRRRWSIEDVRRLDAGDYLLLLRPTD